MVQGKPCPICLGECREAIPIKREGIMRQTVLIFNEFSIPVEFFGSDEKQIPSLLSALKNNKITVDNVVKLSYIKLYTSEAILHSRNGDIYRIPIF